MAFVRLSTTPRYFCYSDDVKSTDRIETGSTVWELDTNSLYQFDGSSWILKEGSSDSVLQEIDAAIGAATDVSEPDHTQDATLIAATKGVNENVSSLETVLEGFQAGTETVQDVINAVSALQTTTETLQDIIDAVSALQTTTETLQDVITSTGGTTTAVEATTAAVQALQAGSETLQSVIAALQDSQITDTVNGGKATKIVDIAPWDRERLKDRSTGAVALAHTLAPGVQWRLHEIRLHLSAAGGDENITATIDNNAGAAYDLVVLTQNTNGVTDILWQPEKPLHFEALDELDFAWANTGTVTYGLEIVYSEV